MHYALIDQKMRQDLLHGCRLAAELEARLRSIHSGGQMTGDNNMTGQTKYESDSVEQAEYNHLLRCSLALASTDIISAFNEWRPYVARAQHHVQVVTDHKNLLYFSSTRTLNRRQARWLIFFADYDFEIPFLLGNQHSKADALSQQPELAPSPEGKAYDQQSQCLLTPDQVQIFATYVLQDETILADITMATATDRFAQEIKACFDELGKILLSRWSTLEEQSSLRPGRAMPSLHSN